MDVRVLSRKAALPPFILSKTHFYVGAMVIGMFKGVASFGSCVAAYDHVVHMRPLTWVRFCPVKSVTMRSPWHVTYQMPKSARESAMGVKEMVITARYGHDHQRMVKV